MWLEYSQQIQQRSLQACSLEVKNSKTLYQEFSKALNQACNDGLLDTKIFEICKFLKMTPPDRQQQVVILGGLEKLGTKNFKRSKDIPHFARKDGCWFDFAIIIDEVRKPAEIIGFDFEICFPEPVPIQFFRFDLNLPGHDNQSDGLRFHLHPSSDDFMVHSPPMSPLEILHLFLYGFEIPPKMRR
ncbi:hypothetical protein C7B77_11375 [Chamaesiphon polymorphus CCALA 037]|uniref:Uncharacterized protein n=2 Tax=Chamaesiphon TaxID=217161 RepID=A0A2T1GG22_9CYAN|nr:hypothetical protein C7B77_11375 [Chamaesiphon polymorphus CCALA 037]